MNTEEAFVLSSLKEFVKLWGSGTQSSFLLECNNGQAWFKLCTQLGSPGSPHFVPQLPQQETLNVDQRNKVRRKGPGHLLKDSARATAHRANQLAARAAADQTDVRDPPSASADAPTAVLPAASDGPPKSPPAVSAGTSPTTHDAPSSPTPPPATPPSPLEPAATAGSSSSSSAVPADPPQALSTPPTPANERVVATKALART